MLLCSGAEVSQVCPLETVGHGRFNLCRTEQFFVPVFTGKWLVFVKVTRLFLKGSGPF